MTRAFVAGATGYTGQAVVEELLERGVEVIAHIRPDSSRLKELGPAFKEMGAHVDTTAWELEAMRASLLEHQPDVVFCLIGTTRARKKELERAGGDGASATYEAVDYGLTALLVQASSALRDVTSPRFVYISSMGVSPKGLNDYMRARYKAEQAIMDSGVSYTIARPGFITGEDRDESRPMERISGELNDALFGALGALGAEELRRRYRTTDAAELARALVRLAGDPQARDTVVEAQGLKDDSPG